MLITVITNPALKEELLQQVKEEPVLNGVEFVQTVQEVSPQTTVIIDLLYAHNTQEARVLQALPADLVIVHAPSVILQELPRNFVRINAWPGFLQRAVVEAAAPLSRQAQAEEVFRVFNKKVLFTADITGLISARVVAAIINEAYLSLAEGVSTKEEMDTAMKLGTNYPFGPFEWADRIGKQELAGLLQSLAQQQERYRVAPLLIQEITT